jgi:hypothetical protein
MNNLGLLVFCVALLIIGSYCVFRPKSVQTYAIKAAAMGVTANFRPLRVFIASERYLLVVRACGLVAYLMFLILSIGLYKSGKP